MVERPSEIRSGLLCPRCGRSLLPVSLETTVSFHCKGGHQLAIEDLLASQSVALRMGLETLLLQWHRQHRAMMGTMEDARNNGHLHVAEIFQRHIRSLEWRIDVLSSAFARSESARLSGAAR